jgi:hypothetical protein
MMADPIDTANEDWLKPTSWDIRLDGFSVETLDDFLVAIEADRVHGAHAASRVADFMRLPAAVAMPAALRAEVEAAFPGTTTNVT